MSAPAEPFVQRHDLARRADRFHRSVGQESQHRGVGDVDMGEGARVRGGARDDDARLRLAVAAVEDGVAFDRRRAGIILDQFRSEEHTSELQSLMRISYAVFCLKKKNKYEPTKTT